MNIFSKTNRSTADAAAKVMAEQPAKVNDYKPHEPSADTSMVKLRLSKIVWLPNIRERLFACIIDLSCTY